MNKIELSEYELAEASGLSKIYNQKKKVTLDTIKKSIAHLKNANTMVTLSSISAASMSFSPTGKAVAPTTILRNEACRALYELEVAPKHRTRRSSKVLAKTMETIPSPADKRRLQRLMRWNKDQLASLVIRLEHQVEAEIRSNSILRNQLIARSLKDL